MQKFNGAVLIISHDRWFLDQTVTKIYELTGGVAALYPGNYSYYREEKKRRFASQLHRYRNERKEEEMIRAEINRLREWSAKAHRESTKKSDIRMGAKEYYRVKAKKLDRQVKSKIKRLERLKETATPKPQAEPKLEFAFTATNRGRRIIDADGLSKAFGEKVLFQESRFFIKRGEKFGLIGPNGCGKTTLLRLFLGEERPDTGSLWISPTLNPGYLRQDLDDLDPSKSALEIMNLTAKEKLTAARTLLAHMGIDAGMETQPTGCLSLGERVRIKLVQLLLDEKDLLLLDEPTNHLDLPGRERLEEALSSYTGTIILVSHDRYLLETVCNKLLVLAGPTRVRLLPSAAWKMALRATPAGRRAGRRAYGTGPGRSGGNGDRKPDRLYPGATQPADTRRPGISPPGRGISETGQKKAGAFAEPPAIASRSLFFSPVNRGMVLYPKPTARPGRWSPSSRPRPSPRSPGDR